MRWLPLALLALAPGTAHAQETAGGPLTGQEGQAARPPPRVQPLPRYALGFAFAGGGQHHPLNRVPMIDLLVFELRWFFDANRSLDLQVDRIQLWLSRATTSQPRLGLSTSYALRRPVGKRFGWVVAPGLDLDVGADALVIDEQLAWRPRVAPALSVRGGLELRTQRQRMNYGLVLHAAVGREHRRLLVETRFTWNGLLR